MGKLLLFVFSLVFVSASANLLLDLDSWCGYNAQCQSNSCNDIGLCNDYDGYIVKDKSTTTGFVYASSSGRGDVMYWKCHKNNECNAPLTTVNTNRNLLIPKGGGDYAHNQTPNPEEVEALRIIGAIKRKVNEHPDCAPAAIMRVAANGSAAVQHHLPEKDNFSGFNFSA